MGEVLKREMTNAISRWGESILFYVEKMDNSEFIALTWAVDDQMHVVIDYVPRKSWKEEKTHNLYTRYSTPEWTGYMARNRIDDPKTADLDDEKLRILGYVTEAKSKNETLSNQHETKKGCRYSDRTTD